MLNKFIVLLSDLYFFYQNILIITDLVEWNFTIIFLKIAPVVDVISIQPIIDTPTFKNPNVFTVGESIKQNILKYSIKNIRIYPDKTHLEYAQHYHQMEICNYLNNNKIKSDYFPLIDNSKGNMADGIAIIDNNLMPVQHKIKIH